jgi:hypothetical protein
MISTQFDFKSLQETTGFGVKQYANAIYRGVINGKTGYRIELGTMVYNTGRVYEGAWMEDQRNG